MDDDSYSTSDNSSSSNYDNHSTNDHSCHDSYSNNYHHHNHSTTDDNCKSSNESNTINNLDDYLLSTTINTINSLEDDVYVKHNENRNISYLSNKKQYTNDYIPSSNNKIFGKTKYIKENNLKYNPYYFLQSFLLQLVYCYV